MLRSRYTGFLFICAIALMLGACNNTSNQAKYIPKDAVVVIGIDMKALTKKVALNAITNSKLFQDIQKRLQVKANNKSFEDAGIDVLNTIYVYVDRDKDADKIKIVGLIPLKDAGKLEAYLKNTFPAVSIKQNGGIQTASLGVGMYAGWNKETLVLMNMKDGYNNTMSEISSAASTKTEPDEATMLANIQAVFNTKKSNSIINNKRYATLEKEGHDIFLWMNYEQLMNEYMGTNMSEKLGGMAMINSFWKNAALTTGFDFVKGKVTGDMHYYIADDMAQLGKELGGVKVDDEIINKLPAQNLDVLATFHLPTKGTHDLLDKLGVLGIANLSLSQQDMDVDYILDAFTGDMAFSLNDFKMSVAAADTGMNSIMEEHNPLSMSTNYTMLLKINKKQNFEKLLGLAKPAMHQLGNNLYSFSYAMDSVCLAYNDKYAVVSKTAADAVACLNSNGEKKQGGAAMVYGHPAGMFVDFQQVLASISSRSHSGPDSAMIVICKNTYQDMVMSGADFNKDNFTYHMEVNFVNKDENGLTQLLDFAMKLNDREPDSARAQK